MKHLKTFAQLFERAVPFSDILKVETQQGLIVSEHKLNGIKTVKTILYDFDDKKILGYMWVVAIGKDFEVRRSVAEKNYGPDIYDLTLMQVYPGGLKPDSKIRPEASKVWKYYMSNRADVKKVDMPKDDEEYVDKYEIDVESGYDDSDKDLLKLINTKFYLEKSEEYNRLIERGKEYLEKYNVKIGPLIKQADALFMSRYNDEVYGKAA